MGKLKEGALKFVICFITGFLAGVLAGIAVLSVIVSYRTDNYYKQISYLEHRTSAYKNYCITLSPQNKRGCNTLNTQQFIRGLGCNEL
jgi:hypothetical protein